MRDPTKGIAGQDTALPNQAEQVSTPNPLNSQNFVIVLLSSNFVEDCPILPHRRVDLPMINLLVRSTALSRGSIRGSGAAEAFLFLAGEEFVGVGEGFDDALGERVVREVGEKVVVGEFGGVPAGKPVVGTT